MRVLYALVVLLFSVAAVGAIDCATVTEGQALSALYTALNGAAWSSSEGWSDSMTDPCSGSLPYGLFCGASGVSSITLNNNNLVGAVPEELSCLPSLVEVNFNDNAITALHGPSGSQTLLTTFKARGNQLSEIPASFAALTALELFDVSKNAISNLPSELKALIKLKSLNFAENEVEAFPSDFSTLTSLTAVNGSHNLIQQVPVAFGALLALQSIDFSHNSLATFPDVLSFSALDTVVLSGNAITQIPPTLLASSTVTKVDFSDTMVYSVPSMASMTSLTFINVSSSCAAGSLTGDTLSLSSLATLDLTCTYLEDSVDFQLSTLIANNGAGITPYTVDTAGCEFKQCPTACPPGQYEVASFGQCEYCPSGYYCSDTVYKEACGPGTYSLVGQSQCTKCAVGTASSDTARTQFCEPCLDMTYQDVSGGSECLACDGLNQFTPADHSACLECGDGKIADATHRSCIRCGPGTYEDDPNSGICQPCPAGSYIPNVLLRDDCLQCPLGQRCAGSDEEPVLCPAGEYQDEIGQDTCKKCQVGTYQSEIGKTSCIPCGENEVSGEGSPSCVLCELLTLTQYCAFNESLGLFEVALCPKGSYITGDRQECKKCSADYTCDGTTKHDFGINMFASVAPTSLSGFLTFIILIAILCGIGYGIWFAWPFIKEWRLRQNRRISPLSDLADEGITEGDDDDDSDVERASGQPNFADEAVPLRPPSRTRPQSSETPVGAAELAPVVEQGPETVVVSDDSE